MTKEEMNFIGSMNMCDEISNEAYQKIMTHCEEQEPCEDCISRQSAIFLASDLKQDLPDDERISDMVMAHNEGILEYQTQLSLLPSVTPQPKVGEWLEKEVISDKVIEEWQSARCSVCDRYHTTPYMYYFSHYEYCPHCGAQMERRQKLDKGRSKRNR
jgi:hypothetical protein